MMNMHHVQLIFLNLIALVHSQTREIAVYDFRKSSTTDLEIQGEAPDAKFGSVLTSEGLIVAAGSPGN